MADLYVLDIDAIISKLLEGKRNYSVRLWKTFNNCLNCLPIAAVVNKKIFCCHGGLSPDLKNLKQINQIERPTDVPDSGLLCDLLWSDPVDRLGWAENERGICYTFGPDIVSNFLHKHDLDLICRAHRIAEDGYQFFAKRQLLTLYSAPNSCGMDDNVGAMLCVDRDSVCSLQPLLPDGKKEAKYQYNAIKQTFKPGK